MNLAGRLLATAAATAAMAGPVLAAVPGVEPDRPAPIADLDITVVDGFEAAAADAVPDERPSASPFAPMRRLAARIGALSEEAAARKPLPSRLPRPTAAADPAAPPPPPVEAPRPAPMANLDITVADAFPPPLEAVQEAEVISAALPAPAQPAARLDVFAAAALNAKALADAAEAHAREAAARRDYESVQVAHQAALAAALAAQQEYQAALARWRTAVAACEAGDYDSCRR